MAVAPKIPDDQIVALLQSDPREAIALILKKYGGTLLWTIKKMVQSDEVAEDLLQDAFVKIWKNASYYDPDKGKLFTWLVQVTRNLVLDKIRTQKYQARQKSESIDATVQDTVMFSEEMNVSDPGLQQQINRLDEKYQEMIELVYFQGYTQSEIVKELGLPLGTVKTRVKIALRELRKVLQYNASWIGFFISVLISVS